MSNSISRWFLIVGLAILAIATVFVLFELGLLARDVRHGLPPIQTAAIQSLGQLDSTLGEVQDAMGDVHSIELETQRTEAEMAGLLNQTRHGMLTEKQETALVDRTTAILDDSDAAIKNLDSTIVQIGKIAPTAQDAIATANQTIVSAQPGILDLDKAAASASTAMGAAAADLGDPAIHETLTHVDGVAGNLDATSSDIHDFVHRETAPVRGTWNVIKAFLQSFAGPAAQVTTAAK